MQVIKLKMQLEKGNDDIIDSRDAITMLSVGSVFAMACALILMMAFQTVFFKRLLLLSFGGECCV